MASNAELIAIEVAIIGGARFKADTANVNNAIELMREESQKFAEATVKDASSYQTAVRMQEEAAADLLRRVASAYEGLGLSAEEMAKVTDSAFSKLTTVMKVESLAMAEATGKMAEAQEAAFIKANEAADNSIRKQVAAQQVANLKFEELEEKRTATAFDEAIKRIDIRNLEVAKLDEVLAKQVLAEEAADLKIDKLNVERAISTQVAADKERQAAEKHVVDQEVLGNQMKAARDKDIASLDAQLAKLELDEEHKTQVMVKAEEEAAIAEHKATLQFEDDELKRAISAKAASDAIILARSRENGEISKAEKALQAGLNRTAQSFTYTGDVGTSAMRGLASGATTGLGSVGAAAMGAGVLVAGATVVTGVAIASAAQFEQSQKQVQVALSATSADMVGQNKTAIDISNKTVTSLNDVTTAEKTLASQGVGTTAQQAGLLRTTVDLTNASLGELGLAGAANLVAQLFYVEGQNAQKTTKDIDAMASISQHSAISFKDLNVSMGQGLVVAKALGITIPELTAAYGMYTDMGGKGSQAGTVMNTVIGHFLAPGKEARQIIKDLGINWYDATGKVRPLNDILLALNQSLGQQVVTSGKMTQAQRDHDIEVLAGVRGSKELFAIVDGGAADYDRLLKSVNGVTVSGLAAGAADTAAAKFDILKNNVHNAGVEFGGPFLQYIKVAEDALLKHFEGTGEAASGWAEVVAQDAATVIMVLGEVGEVVVGVGKIQFEIWKAAGLIMAVFTKNFIDDLIKCEEALRKWVDDFARNFKGVNDMADLIGQTFNSMAQGIGAAFQSTGRFVEGVLNSLGTIIGNFINELKKMPLVGDKIAGVGAAFQGVGSFSPGEMPGVAGAGGLAGGVFNTIGSGIDTLRSTLGTNTEEIQAFVGDFAKNTAADFEGVGKSISKLTQDAQAGFPQIKAAINNIRFAQGEKDRLIASLGPSSGKPGGGDGGPDSGSGDPIGGGGGTPKKDPMIAIWEQHDQDMATYRKNVGEATVRFQDTMLNLDNTYNLNKKKANETYNRDIANMDANAAEQRIKAQESYTRRLEDIDRGLQKNLKDAADQTALSIIDANKKQITQIAEAKAADAMSQANQAQQKAFSEQLAGEQDVYNQARAADNEAYNRQTSLDKLKLQQDQQIAKSGLRDEDIAMQRATDAAHHQQTLDAATQATADSLARRHAQEAIQIGAIQEKMSETTRALALEELQDALDNLALKSTALDAADAQSLLDKKANLAAQYKIDEDARDAQTVLNRKALDMQLQDQRDSLDAQYQDHLEQLTRQQVLDKQDADFKKKLDKERQDFQDAQAAAELQRRIDNINTEHDAAIARLNDELALRQQALKDSAQVERENAKAALDQQNKDINDQLTKEKLQRKQALDQQLADLSETYEKEKQAATARFAAELLAFNDSLRVQLQGLAKRAWDELPQGTRDLFIRQYGLANAPTIWGQQAGLLTMHSGGMVPGGSGVEVPAILQAGEFVIPAQTVQHMMNSLVNNINQSYIVNATYSQVQSPVSVKHDMAALLAVSKGR